MINKSESLSAPEATEYLDKKDENHAKLLAFVKKFNELSYKDAKELRKKLEDLGLIKLNSTHISKIIEILPDKSEEVNKIFTDVSLTEDETNKILDTIKEFS